MKQEEINQLREICNNQYDIDTDTCVELLDEIERLQGLLKEIGSLTQNPREYEPSLYSINYLTRQAIEN